MDLSTTYLGFQLPHPFVPGASPIVNDIGAVRALEDAGAPLIIMPSLFEEQIACEAAATAQAYAQGSESFAEATSYLPSADLYRLGVDEYIDHLRRIKAAVRIPVIASLNGVTPGGWVEHARHLQQAGADALELNLYEVAMDDEESSLAIEDRLVEVVRAVRAVITIPLAVKISPFFTSVAHLAKRLEQAGANGLVVFNRFFQPDIDPETQEVRRAYPSHRGEVLLRLHWLAVLSAQRRLSLAATGGVHSEVEAVKALMCGAHCVQVVTRVIKGGPSVIRELRQRLADWLAAHEYDSVRQIQGSMNLKRCPDPSLYQRGNYIQILQTWDLAAKETF
ncbi:MAG: dihydroorotate dehydrogenase-like protein [Planctomycetota bacterium]|nr:dihydroorotate dehydrogenase-like protein [Planctomycetota bacterium]MCX8040780.1 dihydroorotate dehydrogenase-like protein [Planctomycetota bacterium]MDW8372030.1 dihydroorotate dehydrogenase-like protein [Planctomycetota bacterium]